MPNIGTAIQSATLRRTMARIILGKQHREELKGSDSVCALIGAEAEQGRDAADLIQCRIVLAEAMRCLSGWQQKPALGTGSLN
jgi:hypothetical protein